MNKQEEIRGLKPCHVCGNDTQYSCISCGIPLCKEHIGIRDFYPYENPEDAYTEGMCSKCADEDADDKSLIGKPISHHGGR